MNALESFCRKYAKVSLSYCNPELKKEYHRDAKRVLKEIAIALGLKAGSYEIRSNMGGIAVGGEITLHADFLYIQIGELFDVKSFLVRSCDSRKDYTGGTNHHVKFGEVENLFEIAQRILDKGH